MKRALVALGVVVAIAAPVRADEAGSAPDVVGWWQVGAVVTVTGAGVADGDLLVDGLGSDAASWQAVAALSFAASGGTITIPVRSSTPADLPVTACRVTAAFEPAHGGPADDVPAHDCEQSARGTIADGNLVLDAGALGDATHVRLLLVPAAAGRAVFDGTGATIEVAPTPASPVVDDGAGAPQPAPAVSPVEPVAPVSPVAAAPPPVAAPVTTPPLASADEVEPVPSSPLAALPRFTPPGDDTGSRVRTAVVLGLALTAFTVLNRGGASRLRPSAVAWQRKDRRS